MKVIFAGTPAFSRAALAALIASRHTVNLVLTQPDRASGRGQRVQASAVKEEALLHHIAVLQPVSLRPDGKDPHGAAQALQAIRALECDVMVVAAYGLMLPEEVLTAPRLGCINIHASLLPRWRGAAPIHRAIAAGDTETGITLMKMERGLDTGPMFVHASQPIGGHDTTGVVHDRLAALGAQMIVQLLDQLESGPVETTAQPLEGVTYAHKIDKAESRLDFARDAVALERQIRAFDPTPGAHFIYRDTPIKLWAATVVAESGSALPGTILSTQSEVIVRCGTDALRLDALQKPGGRRLPASEFAQGFSFVSGEQLS